MFVDTDAPRNSVELSLRVLGGRPPWNALSLRVSARPSHAAFAALVKDTVSRYTDDYDCWWCFAYHL
jgi:hypothetical protein